ncbi:hypothetical protein PTKIN_Ptkin01aG0240000 [Pterospermum kingtungense]
MPVSFARPESQRNLSSYFILAMQQDRLLEILEHGLANNGNIEQIKAVANLAMRCLRLRGEKKPTMKEVVLELVGSRGIDKHPWDEANHEESLELLDESLGSSKVYSDMSTRRYGIKNSTTFSLDYSR